MRLFREIKKAVRYKCGLSCFQRIESGRSMVEMIGVLAVMGVLAISGIVGYRYAMDRYRANQTINELNIRAHAIAPLLINDIETEDKTIEMEMGNYTSEGYPIVAYWLENPSYFEIVVNKVPTRICKIILQTEWDLPLVIKVGELAYNGNTSICEPDEENVDTTQMIFQFGRHLEEMLPYAECHTDDDCGNKCAICSPEGLCVTTCNSNERCRQDTLTGSMVCCGSDRWSGPYCCVSTMNGYCCNMAGQCCPWFKPLVDKNGGCYTCDEARGIDVTGVNENCNVCSNREIWNNRCVLPCEDGMIHDIDGICRSCDDPNPIRLSGTNTSVCSSLCPNRVGNAVDTSYSHFCSISCGEGTFTGGDGKCYTCDEEIPVAISNQIVDCEQNCPNRKKILNYCVLECPAGQIRDGAGVCHDCNDPNPINTWYMNRNYCSTVCPNRQGLGFASYNCSIPCQKGTFMGTDGKCYPCDTLASTVVERGTTDCEQNCSNRKHIDGVCILECPSGQIRDGAGVCHDCNDPNPINTWYMNQNYCSTVCPNRKATGFARYFCSIPCENGFFTGQDGKCYPCNIEQNIKVDYDGCERCPDTRDRYNYICVPKCPANAPLRGADNKCYPCDTEVRVSVYDMPDACMECSKERVLDGNFCVLK